MFQNGPFRRPLQMLFYIRDEPLDILEMFKKPQEALLEVLQEEHPKTQTMQTTDCRPQTGSTEYLFSYSRFRIYFFASGHKLVFSCTA